MSFNRSSLSFEDIEQAFDKALESPKGLRIKCVSRSAAIALRSRFNYYRKLNRDENKKTYPTDHPLWGKSVYDALVLRIPTRGTAEDNVLYIEPNSLGDVLIEEIA